MSYAPPSGGSLALEFIGAGYEPPHGAAVNLNFTPVEDGSAPVFMAGVGGFSAGAPTVALWLRELLVQGDDFGASGVSVVRHKQYIAMPGLDAATLPAYGPGTHPGLRMRVFGGGITTDYDLPMGGLGGALVGQPSVTNRLRQVFPLMAESMEDIGRAIVAPA